MAIWARGNGTVTQRNYLKIQFFGYALFKNAFL